MQDKFHTMMKEMEQLTYDELVAKIMIYIMLSAGAQLMETEAQERISAQTPAPKPSPIATCVINRLKYTTEECCYMKVSAGTRIAAGLGLHLGALFP